MLCLQTSTTCGRKDLENLRLSCCHLAVDNAVEQSHVAVFSNMGQCCVAGTRTFVHEDIYDEFVKRAKARAEKRVVGDPYDLKTESGPQVHRYHTLYSYTQLQHYDILIIQCGKGAKTILI